METEHLGHQQMLPWGHLAHTHLHKNKPDYGNASQTRTLLFHIFIAPNVLTKPRDT